MISETAEVRQAHASFYLITPQSFQQEPTQKKEELRANKKDVYEVYHNFCCPVNKLKPYQLLAINRGEKEFFLKVILSYDKPEILNEIFDKYFSYDESVFDDILNETVEDSFSRLIYPSIERDARNQLSEEADLHAVEIFASNLCQLLLQPPINSKNILGIDPGFYSGSKLAVIDTTGKYIEGVTIYPHPPQNRSTEAKRILLEMIKRYGINLIAIGNGTPAERPNY